MADVTKEDVAKFLADLEAWSQGRSAKEQKILAFVIQRAAGGGKGFKNEAAPGAQLTEVLNANLGTISGGPDIVVSWWGFQGQKPSRN